MLKDETGIRWIILNLLDQWQEIILTCKNGQYAKETSMKVIDQAISAIKTKLLEVLPKEMKEGKHDGHLNDGRNWCYECQCSDSEEEFTNVWLYNKALSQVKKIIEEA